MRNQKKLDLNEKVEVPKEQYSAVKKFLKEASKVVLKIVSGTVTAYLLACLVKYSIILFKTCKGKERYSESVKISRLEIEKDLRETEKLLEETEKVIKDPNASEMEKFAAELDHPFLKNKLDLEKRMRGTQDLTKERLPNTLRRYDEGIRSLVKTLGLAASLLTGWLFLKAKTIPKINNAIDKHL